jgi:hypothetical protein
VYDLTSLNAARYSSYSPHYAGGGMSHYAGRSNYAESAAVAQLEKIEKRDDKAKERTERMTTMVVTKGTAFVASGLLGFLQAYKGMPAVGADAAGKGGVGMDAIGALALGGLEFYQLWKGKSFGKIADSAISGAGTGFGCFWFANQGNTYGAAKRAAEGTGGPAGVGFDYEQTGVAGELPAYAPVYAPPPAASNVQAAGVAAHQAATYQDAFHGYR